MELPPIDVPLSRVTLSDLERTFAHAAVDSGWISGTGGYVRDFEQGLAARLGRRHVVAVGNGTLALELALLALEIGPGDEVIVPALTFVAPAAAVRAVGATPVFADVTAESWTVDPARAAELVTPRTRAVVAVDLLGHPCDADSLAALGVPLVEDAAQAHGALYRGRPAGSLGVVSTFSFHANKTVSTGEGGCLATDDPGLAERARLIANHGMTAARPYWHTVVGRNFRMTNVTAAIMMTPTTTVA
jgi:perosamine synthetase